MKNFSILIFFSILIHPLWANERTYFINGVVKDKASKEIIEFVTVELRNSQDSICASLITDSKGEFNIPANSGSYFIIFRHLGYQILQHKVEVNKSNIYMGTVLMIRNIEEIDDVTIAANTYENKIDRDVYIVTKDLKAGVSSAAELLGKLRGVDYDYYDNSIKVNNNAKVRLLIDGLEKNQEYIKNISPDRVLRVEVIKEPGGKYTAEGYAAVINIILKKNYIGVELFITERNVLNLCGANGDNPIMYSNLYSNFTYTYKRLNLYSSYANDITNINLPKNADKTLLDKQIIKLQPTNNQPNIQQDYLTNTFILGADYHINNKHTVSIENTYRLLPYKNNIVNSQYIISFVENGNISETYLSSLIDSASTNNYYVLTAYTGKFTESSKLNIDFAYNYYHNNRHKFYQKQEDEGALQKTDIKKNYTKLNITYFYTLSDITSFELGYANTMKKSITGFISQTAETSFSSYKDMRNSIYSYVNIYPFKKFTAKFGAVFTFYQNVADDKNKNYFRWQPYINIKYIVSDKISMLLKYHSNGNLPNSQQLNPFESIIDTLTSQTGNTLLEPYYTHRISSEFNLFKNKLSIEPYWHFAPDHISKTGSISYDLLYIYTYSNIDMYRSYGIKTSSKFSFFNKSLNWSFSGDIFNSNLYNNELSNTIYNWTIKTNVIYFNKKYMSLFALMLKKNNIKKINMYGYNSKGNDFFALFIRKMLLKQKLNISVLYGIPVNFGLNYNLKEEIFNQEYQEIKNTDISLLKNLFMFKISYRFSSGKLAEKISKKDMIEDESIKNSLGF